MMKRLILGAASTLVLGLSGLAFNDYAMQAFNAGQGLSDFGVTGWAESFADRGRAAAQRARLEARREGPLRDYFPDAPNGWDRVEWLPEHDTLLREPAPAPAADEKQVMMALEGQPTFVAMKAVDGFVGSARDAAKSRRAWVYTRGDRMIVLKARFLDTGPATSLSGEISRQLDRDRGDGRILKVHGGVAFRNNNSSDTPKGVQQYRATIDDQIEIRVDTNASGAEVGRILQGIRYDALRAVLDVPGVRDTDEAAPHQRQTELIAEMKRQKHDARRAELDELARVEKRLQDMARSARNSGKQEVCLNHKGREYCQWVY